MKQRVLGRTGISVTELCFGALPMGPRQKNLNLVECTDLVAFALQKGINFIDTAQMYETYLPIRKAMEKTGIRPVIASKSTASSYEGMEEAILEALSKLNISSIDIFLLHAARVDEKVFENRAGAFQCLKDYKQRGKIKAIGISTHNVNVVSLAAKMEDIDIIFPLLNKSGIGVLAGTIDDMKESIKEGYDAGKGIYLMKVLGGGNLIDEYCESVNFARNIGNYHSIAMGMVSREEVEFNINYFKGNYDPERVPTIKGYTKRYQVFEDLCIGCKSCMKICPNFAIDFDDVKKKAFINTNRCLTCGYCTSACKEFAIRMI